MDKIIENLKKQLKKPQPITQEDGRETRKFQTFNLFF
jgi:hypothetical protein